MKRYSVLLALTVALLLSAGSTYAQSTSAIFNVPFDFVAGTTLLPAGEYHVSNGPVSKTLNLWGSDRHTILLSTGNLEVLDAPASTKLIFHRYGKQYFLAQLWIEGNNLGREVPTSRQESEMAKKNAPESMAVIASSTHRPR